ncbi:hypothetical protein A4X17_00210 [Plantibacter sp. H53]|uniref:DUF998 domain-containing protein n=1 Tax=Plantibacter sp. H53 TaxID=1827323 RepID=UPI0007D9813E|nr:DUF998 domain-containing protein [Plantibacter sp. H53]OAN35827.1 hypothetical protein A4X17_00210 [Plantibacter sp. H53]
MRRHPSTLPAVLLTSAAALYLGLPAEALLGFPLDPTRSYLSELAASDQPSSMVFRGLDLLAGALVLLACAVMFRRLHTTSDGLRTAMLASLALFGIGTMADVLFPMACAPSADARCAAADAAGTLGPAHLVHTAASASALAAASAVAAILLIMVARAARGLPTALGPSPSPRRSVAVTVVTVLVLVTSITVTALSLSGSATGVLPAGGGVVQRVQTMTICLMLTGVPHWLRPAKRPTAAGPSADDSVAYVGFLALTALTLSVAGAVTFLAILLSSA